MEQAHYYNFTGQKAGMDGVDRETVNSIIHEASKNSAYYKQQEKRDADIRRRVGKMKTRIQEEIPDLDHINSIISEIEMRRDLTQTWVHVDMDMFFASVEIRDKPDLADKPVAVGGNSMISTANYVARKFGVRSAMPGFIGKKLCPDLILIKPNFRKYLEEGEKIREIFREYDGNFESLGCDEAHLLLTPYLKERNIDNDEGRQAVSNEIREKIYEKTKLTASAGIACNKKLAKIATDIHKPNGQYYVRPDIDTIKEFISQKEVRKIPGIGKVLEKELNELGIRNCEDLMTRRNDLYIAFSDTTFRFLIETALGIGRTLHSAVQESKSTSISRTFKATNDIPEIENKLSEFTHKLIDEINRMEVSAKTITVFVKTERFQTVNKGESLKSYVDSYEVIYPVALKLLRRLYPLEPIRLLGLKLSNFIKVSENDMKLSGFRVEIPRISERKQESSFCMNTCYRCRQKFMMNEEQIKSHIATCKGSLKRKATGRSGKKFKK